MKQIKCSDFEKEVSQTDEMVLLLFTNDWSGSAIILEGALSALQKKWRRVFHCIKISNDDCREIGKRFNVKNVPTILIFDSGKVVEKISGVPSKQTIENVLQDLNENQKC
ncbi:MAG: thioredoxin family protein [Bacteroidales bacterium]|nr:thioredoxin family protein [Bacteroidales bacterium]MCF8377545.1 thioredoxin family protein [Bacteroidales bacterium]MCF8401789.1 thioredoxin family protein [Bacteroidales bacterium]